MENQKVKLCYEAGVDAIRHIIEIRKSKGKDQFDRLDEDKEVPFVVPRVTWNSEAMTGSLNNEHWEFNVSYAFRDALDLRYIERIRDKKKVNLWTQGALLSFKEGDLITSRCKSKTLQVKLANPMGWDADNNEMYYGSVTFKFYGAEGGGFNCIYEKNVTQLEFLEMLIKGSLPEVKNDCI